MRVRPVVLGIFHMHAVDTVCNHPCRWYSITERLTVRDLQSLMNHPLSDVHCFSKILDLSHIVHDFPWPDFNLPVSDIIYKPLVHGVLMFQSSVYIPVRA